MGRDGEVLLLGSLDETKVGHLGRLHVGKVKEGPMQAITWGPGRMNRIRLSNRVAAAQCWGTRVWESPRGLAPILPQPRKSVCTSLPGQPERRAQIHALPGLVTAYIVLTAVYGLQGKKAADQ